MDDEDRPSYNILVAEDSQFQRLALCDMLEEFFNYNVYPANNGEMAKSLFTAEEGVQFDIVLLDYNMPKIDGLEVLMWMKSKEEYKDIPVIMMSTEEEVKKLYYCMDKGAIDFLVKPIRPHNMKGLSKHIKNKGQQQHPINAKDNESATNSEYTRIRLLGRGGSATVDLVQSKLNGEYYAMKIIPMFHYDDQKKKAAKNEITLLRVLDSPFILKYHEHYMRNGNMYILMEYAEGGVINEKIKHYKREGKKVPEHIVENWLTQCILALMYIHSKNVMHRDIKPENMFLTKDQKLKLGDFGVSREVDVNIDLAKTTCGTPYYMPPEVCNGQRYGHEADIWALGCSFYEIMTFKLPFNSDTLAGLFEVIKNQAPAEPLPDFYDINLRNLIYKMISKNPLDRPSILELLTIDFVEERINLWCSEDQDIKEHIEEHVSLSRSKFKNNKQNSFEKRKDLSDPDCGIEAVKECPDIFIVSLLKNLEPRTIKNGYFSKFTDAFEGSDLEESLNQSECNEKIKESHKEIFDYLIDNNFLIVLRGDEDGFESSDVYTFAYIQNKNPINTIFEFDDEIKDPVIFSGTLLDILISILVEVESIISQNGEEEQEININLFPNFLTLRRKLCKLVNCDAGGLSKQGRSALFLNIYQMFVAYKKLIAISGDANEQAAGLLGMVGLAQSTDLTLQIGKFTYSCDDILHGVLRGNEKKPGAWSTQFKASDPRANILNFSDKRILPLYTLEEAELIGFPFIKFDVKNLEKNLDSLIAKWIESSVAYSNFQQEITIPSFVQDYLTDFNDSEVELFKFISKYFKTKYLTSEQLLKGIEEEDILIDYKEVDDEEENDGGSQEEED